jgi:hypothetical protein
MFAIDIYNKGLATKKKTKTFTTQQWEDNLVKEKDLDLQRYRNDQ